MNCSHCNDTGSLSKDIEGYLDCAYCDVADERDALETWAKSERLMRAPMTLPALWAIYQRGKEAGRNEV